MVILTRIDVLPDDGPVGPKHVGVINFNVLISVKVLKYKRFWNKKTLVQIVGLIIYKSYVYYQSFISTFFRHYYAQCQENKTVYHHIYCSALVVLTPHDHSQHNQS